MTVTLVVIRHAKSDWDVPITDRNRPLAKRGRKQAPATGRCLSEHVGSIDLAVVSMAARTRQTWERVSAELAGADMDSAVETRFAEEAYTFDGRDLVGIVRDLPGSVTTVALVGHNPAVEELVEDLTGEWVPMPTSALAVIELADWESAGRQPGRLAAAGRPADDTWSVRP